MQTRAIVAIVGGVVVIGIFAALSFMGGGFSPEPDPNLMALATCLKDKGAEFYGAFWCPHCQAQKKVFGPAEKSLPYVECSTPDGQGQLPICKEKNITTYPTWVFADGTRETGERTAFELAEKSGCLPPPQPAGA